MTSPSSVTVSGIACNVGELRQILNLPIRFGELAGHLEDDGEPLKCIVGSESDAPEVYVVTRNTGEPKRPREAVVMLGFSGPALARAVFFAQAGKPAEYNRMATWKAGRYLDLLESEPTDDFGDAETDEEGDEG